ncbi:MAG: hypothetical protein WC958_03615 [Dehalococcoidales bacterium]
MSEKEILKEETIDEGVQPCTPPEPTAVGNEQLEVISHSLLIKEGEGAKGRGVVLNLKNNADKDIGKAVFKITFYDASGSVADTVEESLADFNKGSMRSVEFEYSKAEADIQSYTASVVKTVLTPDPEVIGSDTVEILKHVIVEADTCSGSKRALVLEFKNSGEKTLATAVLEVVFCDGEGNVLDTVCHREFEFKPQSICAANITPAKQEAEAFRTYKVSVRKAITTEFEKVQLKSHDMNPVGDAVEVSGVVKNVSDVKTDAAVSTLFRDVKDEKIATRVIYIRDIEPGASMQFRFKFVVPAGEDVNSYAISVGDISE